MGSCMCIAKPGKMAYLALACLYFMFDIDASKLVRKVSLKNHLGT